jgi:lysosomal acid lipase/cholesteryl ester hydrolase
VETSDGYLLKIFQVRLTQNQLEKLPVKLQQNQDRQILIQHAWVDSGDSFFISENSIGFYLVHQGFDVWVGNNRGNKNSRRMISEIAQTSTNEKFFDFSFQEMGIYDQVACYKYILGLYDPTHRFTDKKRKITYLGLSQGSAQMFAGLLEEQTSDFLTDNTEKFLAIGPIVFMGHAQTGVLKIFGKLVGSRLINSNVSLFGMVEIGSSGCRTPPDAFLKKLANLFCQTESPINQICKNIVPGVPINFELDTMFDDIPK